jgi:hypothetical protein
MLARSIRTCLECINTGRYTRARILTKRTRRSERIYDRESIDVKILKKAMAEAV